MEEKKLYNEEDIKKFHLPRWDEIPNIDLYIPLIYHLYKMLYMEINMFDFLNQ